MSSNNFDEVILEPLQKAINNKKSKKLIIVHLMGTHIRYKERYPEAFNKFNTTPKTKFNHDLAHKTINSYDNAVLYNGSIVYSIIEQVKKQNKSSSYVLYLSDHGEDVYYN
ncbi:MAG: sulfatase-like hydrolase/transferase [Flavobacteriales bacterium]|nr:sulfatase-like hydrolase/transferase [Flavobacteriales bacterium]